MKSITNHKRYPWVVVGLLWVVALLNYLDRQMLSTMKNQMMLDINELSTAENFGRLMAVFLWIYALMSPVAGLVADRISKKALIVGSLFVWSLITMLMGFAETFDQLYILRAFMGLSEALYIPAGLSLIADYHQDKTRSLATGIHMTGLYFGQALGGFGATISDMFTWQFTFQTFGVIGVAYSFVLILFLHDFKPDNSKIVESKSSSFNFSSLKNSLATYWVRLAFGLFYSILLHQASQAGQ
jgi:MFS transporter, ACS family, D-galactonate transporter